MTTNQPPTDAQRANAHDGPHWEYLAGKGGLTLTVADRQQIQELQAAEMARLDAAAALTANHSRSWAARIARAYPAFLSAVEALGNGLITALYQALHGFGALVIALGVIVVEVNRVQHGLAQFEATSFLAALGAVIIVTGQFVGEIMIHHVEYKANYHPDRATRGSLRKTWRRLRHWLGIGRDWQEGALSPAARFKAVLRINTFAILILAVIGSMSDVITSQDGTWLEALWRIASLSDLPTATTLLGGLVFSVALVMLATALSRHIAELSVETLTAMQSQQGAGDRERQAALERVADGYVRALLVQERRGMRSGTNAPSTRHLPDESAPGSLQRAPEPDRKPGEAVRIWFDDPANAEIAARIADGSIPGRRAAEIVGVSRETIGRYLKARQQQEEDTAQVMALPMPEVEEAPTNALSA
jgi:hypothetical protein